MKKIVVGSFRCPLKNGGYTEFLIIEDGHAFPSDNFEMAVEHGTPETIKMLKKAKLIDKNGVPRKGVL